jgi:hypothetical protein
VSKNLIFSKSFHIFTPIFTLIAKDFCYVKPFLCLVYYLVGRTTKMATRIYFPSQAVGLGIDGSTTVGIGSGQIKLLHGVQSVSVNTNFNLEQVFELGQLSIYDNIEQIPEVEVSMEKVLDGYMPMYIAATEGSTAADLAARSTKKCMFWLSLFPDTQTFASGGPQAALKCSGMFPQQISYAFPVDGNFTENMTLIGNDKVWYATPGNTPLKNTLFGPTVDAPISQGSSGTVQRRQHLVFAPPPGVTTTDDRVCTFPTQIPGINSSGFNILDATTGYPVHFQSAEVSTSLGREAINELGRWAPFTRYVTFPIEVTCALTCLDTAGDGISGTEAGGQNGASAGSNLINQTIRFRTKEGLFLDLGTRNKIASITYGGGDTGGGNKTITYNFSNYNDLIVKHLQDVNPSLRPTALDASQY